jgi:hypothetical protein
MRAKGKARPWIGGLLGVVSCALLAAPAALAAGSGVRGDFDGDGQVDVLWRQVNSHRLAVWYMSGSTRLTGALLDDPPEGGWTVVGTADFNADGMTDLVWRNSTSNRIAIWFMDGVKHVGGQLVEPPVSTTVDLEWAFAGTGDVDGDGQADLVWHNAVTPHIFQGYVRAWIMAPATATTPATVLEEEETDPDERLDVAWRIAALGDMTHDGVANVDILWRHQPSATHESNRLDLWRMDHLYRVAELPILLAAGASYPGPEWVVAGLWDLNADGKADILWHHQATGELLVWFMNDNVMVGTGHLDPSAVPDTQWKVVGPR